MRKRSALHAARGQIAWILALIVSTAIVVRLEHVSFEAERSALVSNPFSGQESDPVALLARTREAASRGDTGLAQHATALALALARAPGDPVLAAEARAIRSEAEARLAGREDPVLAAAAALLGEVLGPD
ncbi:hypothetical protein [Rubellimicrobium sp. CFH 75288]|uniref:hypothetical protein n=1 Tax=Rubellimicrobium sp. CFH 75288 TaxID=2697034 RepID=UPI001413031A|nr:hypothetical protein [Rubellimicrobium sp. CFH 75288]NAZ36863.1 hypothetical protein [Rubellimicrobium sp. CFH 75288]